VQSRVLITGGARSGKSLAAEARLSGFESVRYVATSIHDDTDPEWSARVRNHRRRRPKTWSTVETADLVGQIEFATPEHPVLIDCLTVWLARRLDELSAWRSDESESMPVPAPESVPLPLTESVEPDLIPALVRREVTELADAIRACSGGLVIVTNEVGSGIVPATVSGRQFRDLMGFCNATVAQVCDEVVLLVAGCELRIKGSG
jgi:adenosylcobinamide kinase/adenosylcobinamide-phosphate guanylyltransferase